MPCKHLDKENQCSKDYPCYEWSIWAMDIENVDKDNHEFCILIEG